MQSEGSVFKKKEGSKLPPESLYEGYQSTSVPFRVLPIKIKPPRSFLYCFSTSIPRPQLSKHSTRTQILSYRGESEKLIRK